MRSDSVLGRAALRLSRLALSSCLLSSFSAAAFAASGPATLTATTGHAAVSLSWGAVTGASGYLVLRGTSPNGESATPIASGVAGTAYVDNNAGAGLTNGQVYYYKVEATVSGVTSSPSPEASAIPNVHLDCGGAAHTDASGVLWAADTGYTGGAANTTAAAITGVAAADQSLYQNQRAEATAGAGFSYSLPVKAGAYLLTLGFAEINGKTAGQRRLSVTANGVQALSGYDIYAAAGNTADKAVSQTVRVSASGGTLALAFKGTVDKATVATIALSPAPTPVADVPPPGYAIDAVPHDDGSVEGGDGPGSSVSVCLPSLVAENDPGADIVAYNPLGPAASYRRMYRSALAAAGHAAPGLSPGWTDNYDLSVTAASPTAWSALTLKYGDGAAEAFTPTVSGSTATFSHPVGAPYLVSGVPSSTTGQWASITLTFADHSKLTFTPAAVGSTNTLYLFTKVTNLVGHSVSVNRDTAANGYRVTTVNNDAATPVTLLQFNYSGAQLQSVQDLSSPVAAERCQVAYTFTGGALSDVSQIAGVGVSAPDQWKYGYQSVAGLSLLATVQAPDPSSPGSYTTATVSYEPNSRYVLGVTDAAGRQRVYTPVTGGTQVAVYNADGSPSQFFTRLYNAGRNTDAGFTDNAAAPKTDHLYNADANNPYLATRDVNRNSQTTDVTYADAYGNTHTVTTPRGVVVTDTYSYTNFALGQLTASQATHVTGGTTDATKQAITIDYYGPADGAINGLIKDIFSPAPGSTNSSPGTVTRAYQYTLPSASGSGGNVSSVTEPGNNSGASLTTTFSYTTDGTYTQAEAAGEPLTATDALGEVTHFRYDGRGNVKSVVDASGYETDYYYNLADQVTQVIHPATNTATPNARAYEQYNYQYVGGPVASVQAYDESAALVREVDTTYTKEGEVRAVTGSTEPASYTYDGMGRVATLTDGDNHVTRYAYDSVGNLYQIAYPGYTGAFPTAAGVADTETYVYDADQNLTSKTDGRGVVTSYARVDPESEVTNVHYSGLPAGVTAIADVSYTYDKFGRPLQMTDGTGVTQYGTSTLPGYDDLDELLLVNRSFSGGPQNQQISYGYYPDGSHKQMGTPAGVTNPLTGINSGQFSYQYDGAQRLTQVNVPFTVAGINGTAGDSMTHAWKPNGWLYRTDGLLMGTGTARPSTRAYYTFNPRGFLTALADYQYDPTSQGNVTVASYTGMTYDALGNRTFESASIPAMGSAPSASHTRTFGYDVGHALASQNRDVMTSEVSALTSSGSSAYGDVYTNGFTLDPAYNLTGFSLGGAGQSFTPNTDNQISGAGFAYDGDGNPLTYRSATFSYDPEDRLTAISSPAFSAAYDGNGLRAVKTETQGSSAVTTYFLYDGETPVVEETYNSSTGQATIDAVNVWGADGWRARYYAAQGAFYAFSFDPEGNVISRQIGNSVANAALDLATYEGYGKRGADFQVGTGANPAAHQDPARFGGQWGYYTDYSTGLVLMTHRYYDPGTGRFVNRDPIGYQGGVNLYAYTGGNPINRFDPNGTDWLDNASNFSAGMGDIISFGVTQRVRRRLHADDVVNTHSKAYVGGQVAGVVYSVADAGVGAVAAVRGTVGVYKAVRAAGGVRAAISIARASRAARSAKTVWSFIKPTQPVYQGSVIPRSFELIAQGGKKFWVHGNATEHIAEYAKGKAVTHNPAYVRLVSQQLLTSLRAAVIAAQKQGIVYDKLIHIGGWELKFGAPRSPGQLPAIVHALYK